METGPLLDTRGTAGFGQLLTAQINIQENTEDTKEDLQQL